MDIQELGQAVRMRRESLGLTQQHLAAMSGLSRTTINLLENGSLSDLGFRKVAVLADLLGLSIKAEPRTTSRRRALLMASRSACVSYREKLTPGELASALATGDIPKARIAHVATLLDEAPASLLVSAVEEASEATSVPPKQIWAHLRQWAADFKSPRHRWA